MKLEIMDAHIGEWLANDDPFETVGAVQGTIVRSKEGRTTTRFELDGQGYYVKHHKGVGWGEIVKNLVRLRLPVIGAANEWYAIDHLHRIGVDTLEGLAYGQRGWNPAHTESFVVTRELTRKVKLSEFCERWPTQAPSAKLRRAAIVATAELARAMHRSGMNHRDLYLCHFLIDAPNGAGGIQADNFRLCIVDLHRAQLRAAVPRRWLVKDLASIYFSAMDIGLTRRDIYRFLRAYTGEPLRHTLNEQASLWRQVRQRARQLYRRDHKRDAAEVFDG